MANYFDNFSSYAVATGVPTGFTARWVTTSVTHSILTAGADKAFRQLRTVNGRGLVTMDAVDGDANRALADVLVRVRLNNPGGSTAQAGPALRCSGSAGAENGYVCYPFSNKLRVAAYKGGASTTILESATLPLVDDAYYWIHFRAEGTTSPVTLKARIWAGDIGDEPETWDVNTTDSSSPITGAGWCGMFAFGATSWDTDAIAVGTNGDTASMGGGSSDGTGSGAVAAITLTAPDGSASGTGSGAATGSGSVAAVSLTAPNGSASGSSLATLTVGPFRNKSNALLASASVAHVVILRRSDRVAVLSLSGQTTNGAGLLVISDAALVAGTEYMVASWSTDGLTAGNARFTAA